jgi:tetratricopeptide (TPR) repeat protein
LAQKDPEPYLTHVAITLNNLGIFDKENQLNEARKEYEEALNIYHELAEKEPETYLSYVAATLNNLGILDRAQNQLEEARKAFEEALNIYKSLAKQDPDQFSPLVEQVKKLLKHLPNQAGALKKSGDFQNEMSVLEYPPCGMPSKLAFSKQSCHGQDLFSSQGLLAQSTFKVI